MRTALAITLLLALPALAQEKDDFKWDAGKRRTPAVGDRWFQVDEETQSIKSKVTVGKEEPRNEDQSSVLKYRVVHEILATEGAKVTKERISVERWSLQKEPNDPEDKSLTGKVVVIDRTAGAPKVTYDGSAEGVSADAKKWVDVTLARVDPMDQVERLLPAKPIAADGEWNIDPKRLADEIFQGTEIDLEKSSAKGTLKNVHLTEDNVHEGDVEIKVALQLKQVPSAPVAWKEGGLVELVVTLQGSLEPEKRLKRSVKMELKLKGRAEQETQEGVIAVKMDMKMATSFASGEMPKKP